MYTFSGNSCKLESKIMKYELEKTRYPSKESGKAKDDRQVFKKQTKHSSILAQEDNGLKKKKKETKKVVRRFETIAKKYL